MAKIKELEDDRVCVTLCPGELALLLECVGTTPGAPPDDCYYDPMLVALCSLVIPEEFAKRVAAARLEWKTDGLGSEVEYNEEDMQHGDPEDTPDPGFTLVASDDENMELECSREALQIIWCILLLVTPDEDSERAADVEALFDAAPAAWRAALKDLRQNEFTEDSIITFG